MTKRLVKLRLRQIWAIVKKNMNIYYLEPPVLIFGVLFPVFLFLAFTQGRNMEVNNLLPGLLGIIFFFTGSSVGPYITPWETRTKTLERVLSTPISVTILILGDITSGLIFGISFSALILLGGVLFFQITISNLFLLIGAIILAAFCFASLGTLFSAIPTDKPSNVMMISNLVRLPLIFISGVFMPLNELPYWGRLLAPLSPVTYVTDVMRYLLNQDHYFTVSHNFLMLFLFALLLFSLSIYFHKRTLLERI
ncbi:ABC transporter permease [Halanaerobaculum tunisiense]